MASLSLSRKITLFFSISVATSYVSPSFSLSPKHSSPKATPSDLLSLLTPNSHSCSVNPRVAQELKSCLKFLVPFTPKQPNSTNPRWFWTRKLLGSEVVSSRTPAEEDELVWWPPQPVLELARLAFDSGGDPDAITGTLDPTIIPVPDIEGSSECKCQLTRTPYGRQFINKELNSYLEFLFELISARGPSIGLNVSLNRYDFFHGHIFLTTDTGRLGILFHAKEYPAYEKEVFPYNMGYCQRGSNVKYDKSMNLRNILWLAPLPSSSSKDLLAPGTPSKLPSSSSKDWLAPGVLVVLDARPDGIIYKDLIREYVHFARTLYEDDFGTVAADVNYLNVGDNYQIFIC